MRIAKLISPKNIHQNQPLDENQIQNNAGGYSYEVDKFSLLKRFLILGSENGTYYVKQEKLTAEHCKNLDSCLKEDGLKTLDVVREVALSGAAPKQDAIIFTLARAISVGDLETRRKAASLGLEILKTATMFFQFLEEVKFMRGIGGRIVHRMLQDWYDSKSADEIAYQLVKYGNRNNWNHKSVLRVAKPKTTDTLKQSMYGYIATGEWGLLKKPVKENGVIVDDGIRDDNLVMPRILEGYIKSRQALSNGATNKEVAKIVSDYNLELTMLADAHQAMPEVWEALLPNMKPWAMLRNLGNLSKHDLLKPLSDNLTHVVSQLSDEQKLKKSRIHPMQILSALYTYSSGSGVRGSSTWNVSSKVVDTLNNAFYKTFVNSKPTNKRFILGIDISGSMAGTLVNGIPNMRCTTAAAAMSLITANVESNHTFVAFDTAAKELNISPRQRLDDVANKIESMANGGTDCAQPILWAIKNKIAADVIVVYTDSETWRGTIHPQEVMKEYRKKMGIPTKLIVVAMASNRFSVAKSDDPLTLNIVGFDVNTPALIEEFVNM
jgi:60 kDa SS-A/Ro ribonucleoprotein